MTDKYVIVQHSGYGYGGKPEFAKGLEPAKVTSKTQALAVERAGGVVFDDYSSAEEYCEDEMYLDPSYGGLIPQAPGTFLDKGVKGLAIYIPRS